MNQSLKESERERERERERENMSYVLPHSLPDEALDRKFAVCMDQRW
jgi:hypothetical protein